jgi:predicted NBD/HSP70 family sugar kinase
VAGSAAWTSLTEPSRSVALEVLLHGPLSRSELAKRLDLSRGTLTRLSRPLIEDGLLIERDGPHATPSGRPGRPLVVDAAAHHFVGVRLTHLEATAVLSNLRTNTVSAATAPLPELAPEMVVAVVAALVRDLAAELPDGRPITGVGIAVAGPIDGGRVIRSPFLGWRDVPLASLVQTATGIRTWVENDIVAVTTAEHWFGAGRGREDFAVVTVGTGVGCGLVIGDRVVNQPDGGVGLVGHLPLGMPGPLCDRGHRGCAAAVLTDGSVLAQAAAALHRPVGRDELRDLVLSGTAPAADRLAEEFAAGLARLVTLVAAVTQVPLVVIAGEGVELAALVEDRLRQLIAAEREPEASPLEVLLEWAGTTQWARGAAAVAVQRYVSTQPVP